MPKRRRQAKIPTPAWERPRGTIGSRVLGRGFQFYGAVSVGVLIVVALGIIGFAFASDEWEKRSRPGSTAIQVEDTRYRLDYFSRRLGIYVGQVAAQDPEAAQALSALPTVADLLIEEEILRRFASEFDVTATEEEIQEGIAARLGIPADDGTFDVVYEQELARSGLSDAEYRQMVEADVLRGKVAEKLEEDLPESAESVRYRQILVSTNEAAEEIRGEIEAGEDFAALAAENSLDVSTKDNGGELGWLPRGVLGASMEELVFALDVGGITTIPVPEGVLVIEMLEKDEDRAVEEDQRTPLVARAFASWIEEKRQSLTIVNSMDLSEGDSKKIEWAIDQVYAQGPVPVQGG